MKTILLTTALAMSTLMAQKTTVTLNGEDGVMHIPAKIDKKAIPHFYGVTITNKVHISENEGKQKVALKFTNVQGDAKKYSLKLSHAPKNIGVNGTNVKHWSIRKAVGSKETYLDIFPVDEKVTEDVVEVNYDQQRQERGMAVDVLSFAPESKKMIGFSEKIVVSSGENIALSLSKVKGFLPLSEQEEKQFAFVSTTGGSIQLLAKSGALYLKPIELRDLTVEAELSADGKFALVNLKGELVINRKQGGELPLVSGALALAKGISSDQLEITYHKTAGGYQYGLKAEEKGRFPVDLEFAVKVSELSGWKRLSFTVLDGAVVPVTFKNLKSGEQSIEFDTSKNVVPQSKEDVKTDTHLGYLPVNGHCDVAWREAIKNQKSELFFTTESLVDTVIGGGLVSQKNILSAKILQGKVSKIILKKEGEGDVVAVNGRHVSHWNLTANGEVEIILTGTYSSVDPITIETQQPLGSFPAKVHPVQLTPLGASRHTGYVRASNKGAVSLEVNKLKGMMQVTVEQFPLSQKDEKLKQVYVYRFPSKQRDWHIEAKAILPEVSVRHILIYGVGASDRFIQAEINLDVREAPLREWNILIPDGYAVSSVKGASVNDYVLSNQVVAGKRSLKFLFHKAIAGRHLVNVSLEKNKPASEEVWTLPHIDYPGVADVRGQIGITTALGWQVVTDKVDQLVEIPLAYFQKKSTSVQQSYRQRKAGWTASVKIKKLSQSVQADVFHRYTIKEGMVECGVFLNYFVVGAPVNEWRVLVPKSAGNIRVVGQNVRSHSKQGDHLVVKLEQPALGGSSLLVKFEESMKAEGGKLLLGQVMPLDVQSESGYIQVISPLQMKHTLSPDTKGLIELEEAELPAEYRVLSSVPTVSAFQYADRPFHVEMGIEWYTPSDLVGQTIDYAKIDSKIASSGDTETKANFFVKTRGKQSLRMRLPEDSKLLAVTVNRKAFNARKDGEDILLSLPAQEDPNSAVEVTVEYKTSSADKTKVKLGVPVFSAPSVITNWSVKSGGDMLIVPVGGNVIAQQPSRGQTGFGWLANKPKFLIGSMALLAAGVFFSKAKQKKKWKSAVGVCWLLLAGLFAFTFAKKAESSVANFETSFEVVAPVVEPNTEVVLEVQQLSSIEAMISPLGLVLVGLGIVTFVVPFVMPKFKAWKLPVAGLMLLSAGLLMQYGGAVAFFMLLVILALGFLSLAVRNLLPTKQIAGSAVVIFCLLGLSPSADAAAESVSEEWNISQGRLKATATIEWKAKLGEKMTILKSPATLANFESTSCRVSKQVGKRSFSWSAIAEKDGVHTMVIRYEMPMQNLAENGWRLLSADAMMRKMKVTVDQQNWETNSDAAVRVIHRTEGLKSISELVLLPDGVVLEIKPKKKDPDSVAVKFFAVTTDLFMPAPGVLDGWHEVLINPISGRIRKVDLSIPAGLMVGNVNGEAIDSWAFDPKSQALSIQLKKPLEDKFSFYVETQKGISGLPAELKMAPIRVKGADKVIGMFGLGFGTETQPDALKVEGMNAANVDDFSTKLLRIGAMKRKGFSLHQAYRYSGEKAQLELTVDSVDAESRVETAQNLYIGEDRLHLNSDVKITVTRAGIFHTRFVIPKRFEVESVTGKDLRDYTESEEAGKRYLTLNFTGKKLGTLNMKIALVANGKTSHPDWAVPQLLLDGAVRQSGHLTVLPQQGIQVESVSRKHVTQEDASAIRKQHPGALRFRLLQADSELRLAIDKLDPWVVADILQEVTLRDGQTRTRVGLLYHVTHAAVKEVFVKLPQLLTEEEGTVRVSGAHVKGISKMEGNLWKVTLRRGMIGQFVFDLEFQQSADRVDDKEAIIPIQLEGVKQSKHYVAVRANERLDMQRVNTAKGWRTIGWKSIPQKLYHLANRGVPEMSYQLIEPEQNLTVQIRRHAMAGMLKLRVRNSEITTLFSNDGSALHHHLLDVEVVEKSSMGVTLPVGASLFSVLVNGEAVPVVQHGEELRFNVTPGVNTKQLVYVQVVYSNLGGEKSSDKVSLKAPLFNTPLEKSRWNVIFPKGIKLKRADGGLELDKQTVYDHFTKTEYLSSISQFQLAQKSKARGMMQQVDKFIKSGDRDKATEILNQVARNKSVGRDMNEDAHDLLTKNQWQHALMGLNTRRQRMYLDNKAEGKSGATNYALEEAASRNPLFRNNYKYDPNQVKDLMQGMSSEDQKSLEAMARLMIDPDLSSVTSPQVIEVTMPKMGTVFEFERKHQLDENEELGLNLELENVSENSSGTAWLIMLVIGVGSMVMFWKK